MCGGLNEECSLTGSCIWKSSSRWWCCWVSYRTSRMWRLAGGGMSLGVLSRAYNSPQFQFSLCFLCAVRCDLSTSRYCPKAFPTTMDIQPSGNISQNKLLSFLWSWYFITAVINRLWMPTTVLLTVVKKRKQTKYPSIQDKDEQTEVYDYIVTLSSHKKNQVLTQGLQCGWT